MKTVLTITKALADETRLRALMMLSGGGAGAGGADGELCVCQIIDALQLAPSTVSKHMTILHDAGLVLRRKEGKWHYYRTPDPERGEASAEVAGVLAWLRASLAEDTLVRRDRQASCCVQVKDREEAAACCYPRKAG